MKNFCFTLITSNEENPLSKTYSLVDGKLNKKVGGIIKIATAEIIECFTITQFNSFLNEMTKEQCLIYGVAKNFEDAVVVTKGRVEEVKKKYNDYIVSRSKDDFEFKNSPGILMLDYDCVSDKVIPMETLYGILLDVVPELKEAPVLIRDSVSSFIKNNETGEFLIKEKGKRIYIPVQNAADIPRFTKALVERLWEKGHGFFMISNSGSLLERTVFDTSVWSPERLDFCAGAICVAPLKQEKRPPLFYNELAGDYFDTQTVKDHDHQYLEKIDKIRAAEKAKRKPEADKIRKKYIETKSFKLQAKTNLSIDECKIIIKNGISNGILSKEWPLVMTNGEEITVEDVLKNPDNYVNRTLRDPVEPTYNDNSTVAKIMRNDTTGEVFIHSFAHGEKKYKLDDSNLKTIIFQKKQDKIVEEFLDVLKKEDKFFVDTSTNKMIMVSQDYQHNWRTEQVKLRSLQYHLYKLIRLVIIKNEQEEAIKPPDSLMEMILSVPNVKLNHFKGFSFVPVIRPDLSWCNEEGYDEKTGYYVVGKFNICENPTEQQMKEAFNRLWKPFSKFRFENEGIARSVFLSALMNIITLPLSETRPLFLISASKAGSGKTKIASCLSYLLIKDIITQKWQSDDKEMEKLIFSGLLKKQQFFIWDNVDENTEMSSAYLSQLSTTPKYQSRILQKSETVTVENLSIHFFTGNNVTVDADNFRRILKIYIKCETENPEEKIFPFDPIAMVKKCRNQMIDDIILLFNGFKSAGCPQMSKNVFPSFESWDKYNRQCVLWLSSKFTDWGITLEFDDLLLSIAQNKQENNTILDKLLLLSTIYSIYKKQEFCAGYIADTINERNVHWQILKESLSSVLDNKQYNNRFFAGCCGASHPRPITIHQGAHS